MDVTITAIDTIGLRIPFDIGAPPPMSQGVPRTHIEGLYIRVTTSNGTVGWGESFGTARPMVIAAFDHWVRRRVVGEKVADTELIPRIERMHLSLGRAGPMMSALSGLDIALWDIRGKLEGVPVSTLLGGAKRQHVECYASLMKYQSCMPLVAWLATCRSPHSPRRRFAPPLSWFWSSGSRSEAA